METGTFSSDEDVLRAEAAEAGAGTEGREATARWMGGLTKPSTDGLAMTLFFVAEDPPAWAVADPVSGSATKVLLLLPVGTDSAAAAGQRREDVLGPAKLDRLLEVDDDETGPLVDGRGAATVAAKGREG